MEYALARKMDEVAMRPAADTARTEANLAQSETHKLLVRVELVAGSDIARYNLL